MSASVDTTVTVWQYQFPFLCLLLRAYVCHTHAGPLPLDNKSASGNMAELIQANRHHATRHHEDSRSHL